MTQQRTVAETKDLASYAEDIIERISTNMEIHSSLEPEFPKFFEFVREAKVLISYSPRFREFSIWISSGGTQRLEFCPWSGKRFPKSLRN